MTFKEIKEQAKTAIEGNRKTSLGGIVLVVFISMVLGGFIGGISGGFLADGYFAAYNAIQQLGSHTVSIFIAVPLSAGLVWLHLDIFDKVQTRSANVFQGFKPYWKVVGAHALVMLYTMLWSILLVIPGIIKGLAYSQTLYILKDKPELGVVAALDESERLMKGNKWRIIGFNLSFILWYLPTFILVGALIAFGAAGLTGWVIASAIALIAYNVFFIVYFAPYYHTAVSGFYRSLTTKSEQ